MGKFLDINLKYKILAILFFIITGNLSAANGAQLFNLTHPIKIDTQYKELLDLNMPQNVSWKVVPENTAGSTQLVYYYQEKDRFCTLVFNLSQTEQEFKILDVNKNIVEQTTGGLIPSSGFPAPCRMIDFSKLSSKDKVVVKRHAGGRVFLKNYDLEIEDISVKTAVENKWISNDLFLNEDIKIFLLVLKDYSGQTVCRQLWKQDDIWWLYEETETSVSYRR